MHLICIIWSKSQSCTCVIALLHLWNWIQLKHWCFSCSLLSLFWSVHAQSCISDLWLLVLKKKRVSWASWTVAGGVVALPWVAGNSLRIVSMCLRRCKKCQLTMWRVRELTVTHWRQKRDILDVSAAHHFHSTYGKPFKKITSFYLKGIFQ